MTQRVTFMRGLSASGKSSVAKAMAADSGTVRVNMDDIRATLALPYNKDNENFALGVQDQIILRALRAGYDVVVDNVHLHIKWPMRIATLLWEAGLDVEYSIHDLMDIPESVCIERNAARVAAGGVGVPDHVIPKQAKDWAKELQREPWTVDWITERFSTIEPYVAPTPQLGVPAPRAIIVDVDGTLAKMADRSPYDGSRAMEDTVHPHVAGIVGLFGDDCYEEYKVIVLTGRNAEHRQVTMDWMQANDIIWDELYTRADGDQRRDSIVKLELFNAHIRDRFDVRAVFDDRLQVVRMWHAMGLPVFRVGDPDADF